MNKIILANNQSVVFTAPGLVNSNPNIPYNNYAASNSQGNNNNQQIMSIPRWFAPQPVPPTGIFGAYVPNLQINYDELFYHLNNSVPFCRVSYISQYRKPNRTPRFTWAYGQINMHKLNPNPTPENPFYFIADEAAYQRRDVVSFRALNFMSEPMPQWLENLAVTIRKIMIQLFNFDPGYNSAIIGKYEGPEDQIGLHADIEPFLKHTFCANITLGYERDFQFKVDMIDPNTNALYKQTYEIKLAHGSAFFFNALEHALPARAAANGTRYSISFRNMATNVGIGNSFYYCRGLNGAINDQAKYIYMNELRELQISNGKEITV